MPGFVLKYCCVCNKRIPEEDFAAGTALEWNNRTYCKEHVPEDARAAAAAAPARSATGARVGPSGRSTAAVTRRTQRISSRAQRPGTPPPGRSSTSRRRSDMRRSPVGFDGDSDRMQAGGGSRTGLLIGVVVLCVALVVVVMVMANSGGASSGESGSTDRADQPNTNRNNGASNTDDSNSAADRAEKDRLERERRQQLEERVRQLDQNIKNSARDLAQYEERQEEMTASNRKSQSLDGFQKALELRTEMKALRGEGITIDPSITQDLPLLVDDWARQAILPYVDQIIDQAKGEASARRFDEAFRLLEQGKAARHPDLPDSLLLHDSIKSVLQGAFGTAEREIRKMRDDAQQPDPVPDPGGDLEEIRRIMNRARELMGPRDLDAVDGVRTETDRMRQLANPIMGNREHPAWRELNENFGELLRFFTATLEGLAERVDRDREEEVARLVEHIEWVLTWVNPQTEWGQRLTRLREDLSASPDAGGLGSYGRDLESALRGSDAEKLVVETVNLRWFLNRFDINPTAKQEAEQLLARVAEKWLEWVQSNIEKEDAKIYGLLFLDNFSGMAELNQRMIGILNSGSLSEATFVTMRSFFERRLTAAEGEEAWNQRDVWWQYLFNFGSRCQAFMQQAGMAQDSAVGQARVFALQTCTEFSMSEPPAGISAQRRDICVNRITNLVRNYFPAENPNTAGVNQALSQRQQALQSLRALRAVSEFK